MSDLVLHDPPEVERRPVGGADLTAAIEDDERVSEAVEGLAADDLAPDDRRAPAAKRQHARTDLVGRILERDQADAEVGGPAVRRIGADAALAAVLQDDRRAGRRRPGLDARANLRISVAAVHRGQRRGVAVPRDGPPGVHLVPPDPASQQGEVRREHRHTSARGGTCPLVAGNDVAGRGAHGSHAPHHADHPPELGQRARSAVDDWPVEHHEVGVLTLHARIGLAGDARLHREEGEPQGHQPQPKPVATRFQARQHFGPRHEHRRAGDVQGGVAEGAAQLLDLDHGLVDAGEVLDHREPRDRAHRAEAVALGPHVLDAAVHDPGRSRHQFAVGEVGHRRGPSAVRAGDHQAQRGKRAREDRPPPRTPRSGHQPGRHVLTEHVTTVHRRRGGAPQGGAPKPFDREPRRRLFSNVGSVHRAEPPDERLPPTSWRARRARPGPDRRPDASRLGAIAARPTVDVVPRRGMRREASSRRTSSSGTRTRRRPTSVSRSCRPGGGTPVTESLHDAGDQPADGPREQRRRAGHESAVSAVVECTNGSTSSSSGRCTGPNGTKRGGHNSPAVAAPADKWFLAEGSTGFFDTFVLIANSDTTKAADVSVTFLMQDGTTVGLPAVQPRPQCPDQHLDQLPGAGPGQPGLLDAGRVHQRDARCSSSGRCTSALRLGGRPRERGRHGAEPRRGSSARASPAGSPHWPSTRSCCWPTRARSRRRPPSHSCSKAPRRW